MNSKIVTLEILWWGASLGGEHYTGKLHGEKNGQYHTAEVKRKVTRKIAAALNKKDGRSTYRVGELTERFDTSKELHAAATKAFRKEFPSAVILLAGSHAVCDPQECLAGPPVFMEAINRMFKTRRECGGYEKDKKTMERLYRQYQALLKEL